VSIESIVEQMDAFGLRLVEITGGEPLIQEETPLLISMLLNKNYTVLVETNGSCDISLIPAGAVAIMDIKTPASGESERMMWENIWKLKPTDEVKFVISDRHDYEWSVGIIHERFGRTKTEILLSAVFGELPPGQLVKWMLADKVPARFNLQIHKYIWPHDRGGV
jgi:7-carboxy-7-deazaguanine synthase